MAKIVQTNIYEPLRAALESLNPEASESITAAAAVYLGPEPEALNFIICANTLEQRKSLLRALEELLRAADK